MMKTPEEIKKGLERCKDDRCICDECEFSDGNVKKWRSLMGDALAYIEQLEKRIDLMLIQMAGDCGVCKHRDEESGPCDTCMHDEDRHGWEYEGLPEVKNGRWVRI